MKFIKKVLAALGVILWVGTLSPEIFINSGLNCILDENGEELSQEDAAEFMEAYFYRGPDKDGENAVELQYKFALLEYFK
ncbi:MAG: hypothetical protein K2O40_01700 [Lachnospiraceae bacterium]|nr:hypothetical protein [Lachnospiraceae bacterium]MDE7183194.1 hypothetical protein [Lachnospiraceae bacterium]